MQPQVLLLALFSLVFGVDGYLGLRLHFKTVGRKLIRPGRMEHAETARWLLARNSWGVLSTKSAHLDGAPFGKVVSVSDLYSGSSSGTPYFLISPLSPTLEDLALDPRSSLTLSEQPLRTCGPLDPQDPLCAKLTLTGTLEEVRDGEEHTLALEGLYKRHPEMKFWPKDHAFRVYALRITAVYLIDIFGGARPVTVEEYYAAKSPPETASPAAKQSAKQ